MYVSSIILQLYVIIVRCFKVRNLKINDMKTVDKRIY